MERYGIDPYAAFEILRRLSQESNIKLAEIAEKLVTADHPPTKDELIQHKIASPGGAATL